MVQVVIITPVMYTDSTGYFPLLIATALIGLAIGGSYAGYKSYNSGNRGWDLAKDIAIGSAIGAGVGLIAGGAASVLLTASTTSSCGAVWTGFKALGWSYSLGGPVGALTFMGNNATYWLTNNPLVGYFPDNDGFSTRNTTNIPAGTHLQRIGSVNGTYVAPYPSDQFSLSLPYDKIGMTPSVYVTTTSITVESGYASPWFGQYGGGIQYLLPESVQKLIEQGVIIPW